MILLDTTKTAGGKHHSGLMRVTQRLARELGDAARPVRWPEWVGAEGANDWLLTAELLSEPERPGVTAFLETPGARTAAIFHDAIPLKLPHITWPQSVARQPGYMKLLAKFTRVWAVSRTSKAELEGFWAWQDVPRPPAVDVLTLGADFNGAPRVGGRAVPAGDVPRLLCIGILEPRKNQGFLVDVCEELWAQGMRFELHVVGRVNPHFGGPVRSRIRQAARIRRGAVVFHEQADDATVARLYAGARATVFPTIAEGCGLPLVESLWMGVPCVCSDLPVLRENADGGGCLPVPVNDRAAWAEALRRILTDTATVARLTHEATTRPLPTWADTAATLRSALGSRQSFFTA